MSKNRRIKLNPLKNNKACARVILCQKVYNYAIKRCEHLRDKENEEISFKNGPNEMRARNQRVV